MLRRKIDKEFAKKGYDLFYYDKKSKHELDFLLEGNIVYLPLYMTMFM